VFGCKIGQNQAIQPRGRLLDAARSRLPWWRRRLPRSL